jgi:hypothetical protein
MKIISSFFTNGEKKINFGWSRDANLTNSTQKRHPRSMEFLKEMSDAKELNWLNRSGYHDV